MSNTAIKRILDMHSIEYHFEDGDIIAHDYYTSEDGDGCDMVNVTNWSKEELLDWLGY